MWKDVIGYEGLYKISDTGDVKSLSRIVVRKNTKWKQAARVLRKSKSAGRKGARYLSVGLCKNGCVRTAAVHRLVAAAFLPKPKVSWHVNHKDGNKQNNSVENLEWVSSAMNNVHALHTGLRHPYARPVIQLDPTTRKIIKEFRACVDATNETGINKTALTRCCQTNKLRSKADKVAHGFIWMYKEDYK